MDNILHFYYQSIDEVKQQQNTYSVNYLTNRDVERNYFAPLSVATSFHVDDEYIFSNYMDSICYSIHTPYTSNLYTETMIHKHSFFELMYVKRGTVHMKIENDDFTYGAGSICLLNRNARHIETDISDTDIYYVGIEPQFITNWPQTISLPFGKKSILKNFFRKNLAEQMKYKKDYINFTPLTESVSLTVILEEIIAAYAQKRTGYQFDIYSSLCRLFATLDDDALYKASYISMAENRQCLVVEQAKKLIDEKHGCIKRYELADQLSYSDEYLSRIIKKYTGYTLKAYCQRMQMLEAARLLKSTSLPITQIASSLGYENRTQFYHNFKHEFHMTPAQYRTSHS